MDDRNPADELPELYRKVLDALARLEAAGDRTAAYDLRVRAHRTYATRWDEGGRRTLHRIARDADARLASSSRTVQSSALAATAPVWRRRTRAA